MQSKKSNNNNSPNMAPKKRQDLTKKQNLWKRSSSNQKIKWPHNSVIDPLNIVFI
jgi:hypothetical protein